MKATSAQRSNSNSNNNNNKDMLRDDKSFLEKLIISSGASPCNNAEGTSIDKHHSDEGYFDTFQVNPRQVEALLVQELNQLSARERERIMEEVHGVHVGFISHHGKLKHRSQEEETEIRLALAHMQVELKSIPDKLAYDEAIAMKSPMLNDIAFQTKFVYAENFDPSKAAKRMVKYLELAKELFGVRALHQAVKWKDLSPYAIDIINRGEMQTPPFRDQSRRRICVLLKDDGTPYPTKDRVRADSMK
jgi:hypothetical protein